MSISPTPPNNPLIRIAREDVILPIANTQNKVVPKTLLQSQGWDEQMFVGAQTLNYIFDNLADWIQYLDDKITKREIPVGGIFERTGSSENPAITFGYGEWQQVNSGLVHVGVGSYQDKHGVTRTWTDGQVQGEFDHRQTESEMASHGHSVTTNTTSDGAHANNFNTGGQRGEVEHRKGMVPSGVSSGSGEQGEALYTNPVISGGHSHSASGTAAATGSGAPANVIQPSIGVYRWKRIK